MPTLERNEAEAVKQQFNAEHTKKPSSCHQRFEERGHGRGKIRIQQPNCDARNDNEQVYVQKPKHGNFSRKLNHPKIKRNHRINLLNQSGNDHEISNNFKRTEDFPDKKQRRQSNRRQDHHDSNRKCQDPDLHIYLHLVMDTSYYYHFLYSKYHMELVEFVRECELYHTHLDG